MTHIAPIPKPRCREIMPGEWECSLGEDTGYGESPCDAYTDLIANARFAPLSIETSGYYAAVERPWGHCIGGRFVSLPKAPMVSAGYGPPPFAVTRPDGMVIQVVEGEDG